MDEAIIAGRGGFETRAELMREAVENLLNELTYPEAPVEPIQARTGDPRNGSESADGDRAGLKELTSTIPSWELEDLTLSDLAGTALRCPQQPWLIAEGAASVPREPLLGLHNRDYVSVWALHRLARYTSNGPIPFDQFLDQATRAAWYFGTQLEVLERSDQGRKLTVLFPTNATKRPSAERGFQSFAIGSASKRSNAGSVNAAGPLFAWGAVQLADSPELLVGVTEEGWRLMRDLDGISLDLPHCGEHASRFLAYLDRNAPQDRWGFDHALRLIANGPNRDELVGSFAEAHPEWTPATASSVAQGYVARSREWGLVEPKMVEGRYWLTDAGRELLKEPV